MRSVFLALSAFALSDLAPPPAAADTRPPAIALSLTLDQEPESYPARATIEPIVARAVPTAPAARLGRQEVVEIVREAAREFGADYPTLYRIAGCESSFDAAQINAVSGAAGTFQFLASSWPSNARAIGLDGEDRRLDAVASARVAAAKLAREGPWAWRSSESCWRPGSSAPPRSSER